MAALQSPRTTSHTVRTWSFQPRALRRRECPCSRKTESAAGCTYCAVSTLVLLGKLPPADGRSEIAGKGTVASQAFVQSLVHWLVSRQTSMLADYRESGESGEEALSDEETKELDQDDDGQQLAGRVQGFSIQRSMPVLPSPSADEQPRHVEAESSHLSYAGFNGRCNKPADTCYSFWVGGSLSVGQPTSSTFALGTKDTNSSRFSTRLTFSTPRRIAATS